MTGSLLRIMGNEPGFPGSLPYLVRYTLSGGWSNELGSLHRGLTVSELLQCQVTILLDSMVLVMCCSWFDLLLTHLIDERP